MTDPLPAAALDGRQEPLNVRVADGRLVVSMGIDTLAYALKFAPWAAPYNETAHDYLSLYIVTDADELAKDVKRAMLDEAEDGSSPLTNFLDAMTKAAIEDGSLGVEDDPKPANPYMTEKP
jgi:hypothetical protein